MIIRILCIFFQLGMMNTLVGQSAALDLQGHRGCRGLMPENTIPAMLEALRIGVTTLEMDVVITRDKRVVLSHEPFMNPDIATPLSADALNNIYQLTYDQVRQWDVGLKPHPRFPQQTKMAVHKPLLSDVIDAVEHYVQEHHLPPVHYNIETKIDPKNDDVFHPKPGEFVALLMEVVQKKTIANRTIIQSFDPRTLRLLKQRPGGIRISYLVERKSSGDPSTWIAQLGFKPDIISPEFSLVDADLIGMFHEQGVKVIVWTVNQIPDLFRMHALGVDGIISDYPDRFDVLPRDR
ncbi:MAG: glycerophosphodiester phosphodiesterase family protein [Bacteroidota bacterium]